jgi:hypothetical protein
VANVLAYYGKEIIAAVKCFMIQVVANAKFSLLKLLIYEPYYYYALVGWSARSRLEPSRAIGTSRALPRPPSTRLGCHAIVYIFILCWTNV